VPGRQARKRPMLLIRKRVQWHQAAEVAARDPGRVRAEVRARAADEEVARFRARAVAVVPAEDTEPEAVVPAEVLAEAVPVKAPVGVPVAGPDQAVAKGAAEAAEEKNGAGRLSALIKPADSLLLIK